MPNQFGLAGAQPQRATKFAPLYNGRFSVGLWTNRSPLRDASTTRLVEKFYGAAGDALIAGSNVEVTTRLTLGRRPGNSVFDSNNTYTSVDRFYEFRLFGESSEQIKVMVDQADALYALYNGIKTLLWTKVSGAGQSFMQSVGNSLYWGDGASNKKWLESLNSWQSGASWNGPTTPFFSTFLIDTNGNIQQLTGTILTVTQVAVATDVLTVTTDGSLIGVLSQGCKILFPASMTATFLENQTVTVTGVSGSTFTAEMTHADYGPAAESSIQVTETSYTATPVSGTVSPVWSTTVPDSANKFAGGTTIDGTAQWTNRGAPVQNWGILNGTKPVATTIGTSSVAWRGSTYFSLAGVIIDSNGNLQQVSTPGKSGSSAPTWATSVNATTQDGAVVWKLIQTAASMNWQAHTTYTPSTALSLTSVAAASGGTTVYSGTFTGGDANGYASKTFVVSGWTNSANNGTFVCTASTTTTLTLQNAAGVAETGSGTATTEGQFAVARAYDATCLFQLAAVKQPTITGAVSAYLYDGPHSGPVGNFTLHNPTSTGSALASATNLNSLSFVGTPLSSGSALAWNTVNGAGEYTGTTNPFPSYTQDYQLIILTSLSVPVAGQYTFTIKHNNGVLWGIGNNATLVSGSTVNIQGQTVTAAQGYPILGGTNSPSGWTTEPVTDTFTVNFPAAGVYPVEIDYSYWYHSGQQLEVQCNGFPLANGLPESGANAPVWPAWSTQYAPNYPTVTETNGQLTWINLGPTSDFVWAPTTAFTFPGSTIIDANGNTEAPYRTGVTGSTAPTFASGLNQLTLDNPNLIWINQGATTVPPSGTISTYNGGWKYCVALVNTLDNTVSNCTPISAATGNFIGVSGISIAAGAGLPDVIDPQSDYVAVFRTTDGLSTPFLIPGETTTYTVPLSVYLSSGYTDTTPDIELNNLIAGAIAGENTPPAAGAKNLVFHLNRIWYSIGNVVYWTAGPDTPVGNGVNGTPPLNFANFPSLVTRIVPTAVGAIVFTVSDVYVIQGQGTASNPIQAPIPIMEGVGILNYNALDVNGSIIGFFTTDNQFCILTPDSGASYAGFPIGDQFRLNNGHPGQSWDAAKVYVTWHCEGEDQGWYVSDGANGWFRLMPTPAPEQGYTWSPFATIVGGCKAVQSVEVTPGVHKLLLGPVATGSILQRDLTAHQDNGQNYPANAVVGSAVLAQPGQVAVISFVTTESVRVGTPLVLGVLIDEALPYYTGPFDILKKWESDPPGLKQSKSFYAQRFYLNEARDEAACRHCQVQINWAAENAANELVSLTIFGGYLQET